MKVLVWHGPRNMTVEQREVPKPGPGEALLQVKAVGICGSEIEGYLGQNSLRLPPLIMGHEFSGEIVDSGSMIGESPTPGIGQRVTVNPLVSCGTCMYCKAGLTHVCPNRKLIGAHRPGAFADYVVVPQRNVIPLPDSLPDTLAALTEPFAVSIHGVKLAHLRPDDAVVVWGAGSIGLLTICAARQAHPTRIIAVDTNEARLASATAAGATTVLDARSDTIVEQVRSLVSDAPRVVVFDAVGRSITRVAAAAVAGPCGRVILLGLHEQNTSFDVAALIRSEIALQGCYGYSGEDLQRAVAWLAAGFVPTGSWIDVRPLEAGPDAFLELVDRPGAATKIVMVP